MEKALKAYKNSDFLQSREARTVRILCEYLEPEKRLEEMNIRHTVVFFGSARVRPENNGDAFLDKCYWAAEEFAYRLAEWSKTLPEDTDFTICTGGGPGIMEAANRGAARAGERNIGFNISLPFEQHPNDYISPDLNFEFHYFFMRKLWFLYHAKALIVFPGGFGTLDELFEVLTLKQTRKLEKHTVPVLLYNREYWNDVINFQKLVDMKLILPEDIEMLHFFDTPEEGFEYLKNRLIHLIKITNYRL